MNEEDLIIFIDWLRDQLPSYLEKEMPRIFSFISDVKLDNNNLILTYQGDEKKSKIVELNIPDENQSEILFSDNTIYFVDKYGNRVDILKKIKKMMPKPVREYGGGAPREVSSRTERITVDINGNRISDKINYFNFTGNVIGNATNNKATIEVTGGGGGLDYQIITQDIAMENDKGYIIKSSGDLNLALPTSSALGSVIEILCYNDVRFTVTQDSSQRIIFGDKSTSSGPSGNIISTKKGDSLKLVCVSADLEFMVSYSIGNFNLK